MAGRVKYIAALIVVISLLYVQHSSVTYAGGQYPGDNVPVTEEKPPEEGEEKPSEEGEEKPSEEGEEKPPEEGEEKPSEEEEEKPPEEGEGEEALPLTEYSIEIPKANGKKGYYTKKPKVMICHRGESGKTKYYLKHGDKKLGEKTLNKKGEKGIITEKLFAEGKNILHIWMEDENGDKYEKYELKKEILVDTEAPEIQMSVPKGFDKWYQGQVTLCVSGEDSGSGVAKISCREGEQSLGSVGKSPGEFVISKTSAVGRGTDITVTAEDKAGNKSEKIKTVYIDKAVPEITITGADNYMITGETINLACGISEDNILQEFYMQTEWENVKGRKKQLSSTEWRNDGTKKTLVQTLKNDGIYRVKVYAKDMAGHAAAKELQIIIDKTNPVIRYVQALNGRRIKKFKWEYPTHQMISDFTTYVYDIRVDGQLYHMGETIYTEGKHRMAVKVTDAAGNQAQSTADFIIDNTAPEIIFKNIEGKGEYEEKRTFSVELKDRKDEIRQIQINGENQETDIRKKSYEYTLNEPGEYEVTVSALDNAGNESVKSIFFRIMPKKSLAEKIADPVKVRWSMGEKAEAQFAKQAGLRKGEKADSFFPAALLSLSCLGLGASFLHCYRAKCRKKKPKS